MWAVIGVWKIEPSLLDELRALVPAMAEGKVGMPGFLHGTWTLDGHAVLVFADEQSARRYHGDMLAQGAVERPGSQCIVWDVAEVGAESSAPVPDGDHARIDDEALGRQGFGVQLQPERTPDVLHPSAPERTNLEPLR